MATTFDSWVGREEERSERILPSAVQAMAATLDLDGMREALADVLGGDHILGEPAGGHDSILDQQSVRGGARNLFDVMRHQNAGK